MSISRFLPKSARRLLFGAMCIAGLSASHAVQAEQLNIGVGIDPVFTPFFMAEHEKLFEKHGLDINLMTFAQGGEALDALIAGQVVMAGGAEPTVMIRMARADVRALSVLTQSGEYLKLALGKGIEDPSQIKNFGAIPGGALEYLAGITIRKYDLNPDEVNIIKAGPPEMPALLARGDIDAFWLFEPFVSMAENHGGKVAAISSDVGYTYTFWTVVMNSWLEENRSEGEKIMAALAEACDMITADPERAAEAVQARVKIPAEETARFLQQVTCKVRDFTAEDYESFDSIADFLAETKITTGRVDYRKQMMDGFIQP